MEKIGLFAMGGLLGALACSASEETNMTKDVTSSVSSTGGGGNAPGGNENVGGDGGDGNQGGGGSSMGAPPIVVASQCDTIVGASTWAIAQFPGKDSNDLARVTGFVRYSGSAAILPAGFDRVKFDFISIQDGEVAARCLPIQGADFAGALFVLPVD